MLKLKKWFIEKFLPSYARELLLDEHNRLLKKLDAVQRQLEAERNRSDKLLAYVQGAETVLKHSKSITINIKEGGAAHGSCTSAVFGASGNEYSNKQAEGNNLGQNEKSYQ